MWGTLLLGLKLLHKAGQKIIDLHNKGVDKAIIDEVNAFIQELHDLVDSHHKEHVGSDEHSEGEKKDEN